MANYKISIGNVVQMNSEISDSMIYYTYKDFNTDMIVNPTGTDFEAIYNVKSIENSLNNLFSYEPGQRILNQRYGCNLRKYLYMPINSNAISAIGMDINNAIKRWEPRITLKNISVVPYEDNNMFVVNIVYECNGIKSNKEFNYSYTAKKTNF